MNQSEGGSIIVISGIDTGIGKTVATGLLARWLQETGKRVITMKMVQTGDVGLSEDVRTHRQLAHSELLEEDAMGLTCPYVFSVPCAPHLAARLDGNLIEPRKIADAALELAASYEYVLMEGIGGLFVPLTEELTLIDFVAEYDWPVILVTGPRLGSINHTLGSLEALERRAMKLVGLIYNLAGSSTTDARIVADSRRIFGQRLVSFGCADRICDIPDVACTESYCVDFSGLFS